MSNSSTHNNPFPPSYKKKKKPTKITQPCAHSKSLIKPSQKKESKTELTQYYEKKSSRKRSTKKI